MADVGVKESDVLSFSVDSFRKYIHKPGTILRVPVQDSIPNGQPELFSFTEWQCEMESSDVFDSLSRCRTSILKKFEAYEKLKTGQLLHSILKLSEVSIILTCVLMGHEMWESSDRNEAGSATRTTNDFGIVCDMNREFENDTVLEDAALTAVTNTNADPPETSFESMI